MSFSIERILTCGNCGKRTFTSEIGFPDDVHDALMQLNFPQLYWICLPCEDILNFSSTKRKSEINESTSQNSAVGFTKSGNGTVDKAKNSLNGVPCNFRSKLATTIVNEILKTEVKIDNDQSAKSSQIVTSFLDCLIPYFKKDEVFAEIYQRIYYTGSSYNDLKISEAVEYDVNLVLNVPKQINIMPEFYDNTSMFAKLKWWDAGVPEGKRCVAKFLKKTSSETFGEFLDPLKIVSWLQSLIDKFIKSKPEIPDVSNVKTFQSGPARTVKLDTVYNYSICIDLVPVFQFDYSALKNNPAFEVLNSISVEEPKKFWFLVPKPCRGEQLMYAHEMKLSWRVHLPEVERAVLHHKQCAKPVIKLLKLLRDKQDWGSYLSSYHCKTVVLWELKKHPDSDYWSEKFLYERMMETLKSLIECYKKKNLPYFFNQDYNLFYQLTEAHALNMNARLSKIVKEVEANPENLKKYFKFQSELKSNGFVQNML